MTGKRTLLKLKSDSMKLNGRRILRITLGMSRFTMVITNSSVQIMYNAMLQKFGGDLYVWGYESNQFCPRGNLHAC